MKSVARTIIYSLLALVFMSLFVLCCVTNGGILPADLAKYIGQGAVEVTDAAMLFEILGLIYPFFAILLFAPLSCMLLRRGCNAVGALFAVLWTALVFVMEIFYASDIDGNTVGLFNMDFTVEQGNMGWLYLAMIAICFFSCVISAIGFGRRFDELLSGDDEIIDRVKGILLSVIFSNIIMTVVAFITFVPPFVMAFINYGLTGEDIPTIFHAFVAENAIIALIGIGAIMMLIAPVMIVIFIVKSLQEVNFSSGYSSSSGDSSVGYKSKDITYYDSAGRRITTKYQDDHGIIHDSESLRSDANKHYEFMKKFNKEYEKLKRETNQLIDEYEKKEKDE